MASPENANSDPRLEKPDEYFVEKYGDVVVKYREHELSLHDAVQFENLVRPAEDINNDPKEKRANVFIGLLRNAGALEPEDDLTYQEPQ